MSHPNLTPEDVIDMERREMLSRLRLLTDAIEEAIDKTKYYDRPLEIETLEVIRDDIRSIMRIFAQ